MEGRAWAAGYIKPKSKPKTPGRIDDFFINDSSKTLNWSPPNSDGGSPITGYSVLATSTGGQVGAWTPDAKTRSVDMSKMLANKKKYTGSISANNANGVGPLTQFSGELGYPSTAPKPTLVSATGTTIIVKLGFDPSDGDLTLSYDIQWRKTGTSDWDNKSGVAATHGVTGLTGGTSYEVQSRCSNTNGIGAWSASLTVQTTDTVCRPPVLTKIVPIDFGGIVEWTYDGAVEPSKFRMKAVAGEEVVMKDVNSPNTDGTIDALKNGVEYTVTVSAFNSKGEESSPSNGLKLTPIAPLIPSPTLGTAVGGDGKITFTFGPADIPSDRTLKHYSWEATSVANKNESYSDYVPAGQYDNCVAVVPNDLDWDFRLFTVTTLDEASDPSNVIRVHTEQPITPYKPDILDAYATEGGVLVVKWAPEDQPTAGGPMDIDQWRVFARSADGKGTNVTKEFDGAVRTWNDQKLTMGYWEIFVSAHNTVGWSEQSKPATVFYSYNYDPVLSGGGQTWEDQNYYYLYCKADTTLKRSAKGANTPVRVALVGAGGSGHRQTLIGGKGGNGAGGQLIIVDIPAPGAGGEMVVKVPGGATENSGDASTDASVVEGANTFTAKSGGSATNKDDATGYGPVEVPDSWRSVNAFAWNKPYSYTTGGVVVEGTQGFPNGYGPGQGGAGVKVNKAGNGEDGLIVFRWRKDGNPDPEPLPTLKRRKKWFGK